MLRDQLVPEATRSGQVHSRGRGRHALHARHLRVRHSQGLPAGRGGREGLRNVRASRQAQGKER